MNVFKNIIVTIFSLLIVQSVHAKKLHSEGIKSYWSGTVNTVGSSKDILEVVTKGNSEPSFVGWKLDEPVSMLNHYFKAVIKVSDLKAWSGIELRMSNNNDLNNYYSITIPVYSDSNFNWVQPGAWQQITLTMGEALKVGSPIMTNLDSFSFYIQDKGTSPLKVSLSGAELVEVGEEAIISVTFDDGYDETLKAAQIMEYYGLRGTAYIIPKLIGKRNYLTEAEVLKLANEYGWGVSAHHEIPFTQMSPGQLSNELDDILEYLVDLGLSYSAAHLAFPLGKTNHDYVLPLSRQKLMTSRIAGGGAETLPPADWHRLRVFDVRNTTTAEDIRTRIKLAKQHKEWLILMFHYLDDEIPEDAPSKALHYTYNNFEELMKEVSESKIITLPVHEVWEGYRID